MWLINTSTLGLENFHQCPTGAYAILSHTWGSNSDELSFEEFQIGQGRQRPGFRKIQLCCEQARRDGLGYAWVDTCCIDKRSSTELSEAINSMFSWYQSAKMCYVFLGDVCNHDSTVPEGKTISFVASRWFTRGWTLQELIAPRQVVFYNYEWSFIGYRSSLAHEIHTVTQIALDVLTSGRGFRSYSIAQRMSWASNRQTTRLEDIAYCLIGLFDVNMPLLYGEGRKAFKRLQEEIIQQTDDETIFAWTRRVGEDSGLLAVSPRQFAGSVNIRSKRGVGITPHSMTPRGLEMECLMLPWEMNSYMVLLQCEEEVPGSSSKRIGMFVARTSDDLQHRRISYRGLWLMKPISCNTSKAVRSKIFIRDLDALPPSPHNGLPLIHIESELYAWHLQRYQSQAGLSYGYPDSITQLKFFSGDLEKGCVIAFSRSVGPWRTYRYHLELGFDREFRPICILYPSAFMLIARWCPLIIPQFIYGSSAVLPMVGDFWSEQNHECHVSEGLGRSGKTKTCRTCRDRLTTSSGIPIIPFRFAIALINRYKGTVMRCMTGTRTHGLRLSRSHPSFRASRCTQIEISVEPLEELNWILRVQEKPLHPQRWPGGLCFTCLFRSIRTISFRLLLLLLFAVICLLCPIFFLMYVVGSSLSEWLKISLNQSYYLCAFIIFAPLFWFFTQWLTVLLVQHNGAV